MMGCPGAQGGAAALRRKLLHIRDLKRKLLGCWRAWLPEVDICADVSAGMFVGICSRVVVSLASTYSAACMHESSGVPGRLQVSVPQGAVGLAGTVSCEGLLPVRLEPNTSALSASFALSHVDSRMLNIMRLQPA
jgi:hypothetical protein